MEAQTDSMTGGARKNQWLWFAGAVGATAGLAVWAYRRKEPTYWERTRRTAGRVADSVAEMNPWLAVGAGTLALGGSAALAYRRRAPKGMWQRAGERGGELVSRAGEQLLPLLGTIASAAISVASAAYSAKARQRATEAVTESAGTAADKFVEVGSRIRRRLGHDLG